MLRFITAALIFLCVPSIAYAEPCPPKRYFCWQAKLAFEAYGVDRVVAKARACNWNERQIKDAMKCLK